MPPSVGSVEMTNSIFSRASSGPSKYLLTMYCQHMPSQSSSWTEPTTMIL